MATTFDTALPPTLESITHPADTTGTPGSSPDDQSAVTPMSRRVGALGLLGLRLAIGFEFLWAFLDKVFGFGWHTASGKAWIHGGSPTTGFLSGVHVGPLQGFYHSLAGVTAIDWLFMMGLLGVGVALDSRYRPAPRRDFGVLDPGDDVRRELAVRQAGGRRPDCFDQPDRRRPHRQLHGSRCDRCVRRNERWCAQPPLVCTRLRSLALLDAIARTTTHATTDVRSRS